MKDMYQPLFVRPITGEEKEALARSTDSTVREEASRAEVILLSIQGKTIPEISTSLGFHPSNIKKWIRSFNESGLEGISVKKRGPLGGPRPKFTRQQIEAIVRLSRTEPVTQGYQFKQWTPQKIAAAAVDKAIVERISHVTVRHILKRQGTTLAIESEAGIDPMTQSASSPLSDSTVDDAQLQIGKELLARSDYESAERHLHTYLANAVLSIEEEASVRCLLSQSLEELSRYEEAYEVLKKYEEGKIYGHLSPATRARVKLRFGWANSWLRNYPEAIAALNDAKKLFLELENDQGVCESYLALGRTYHEINEYRIARDHLLTAANYEGKIYNPELLAQLYFMLGTVDFNEGAFSRSIEKYLVAFKFAEGSTNNNLLGKILLNLGTAYLEGHVTEESEYARNRSRATEYLEQAVALLEKGGHRDYLALAYNNLADNFRYSGLWTKAIEILHKAISFTQHRSHPKYEATSRITLAEILCAKGELQEAQRNLTKSLELIGDGIDTWLESAALRILALVHRGSGRTEEAFKALRESLQLSTSIGDLPGVTWAQLILAESHFLEGRLEQAREYLELTQGRLKEEKSLYMSGLIQRLTGQLETSVGRLAEARQHIAQSISIFTTTDIPHEIARSHAEMGQLLKQAADAQAAKKHLLEAREIFSKLQASPDLEAIDKALQALDKNEAAEYAFERVTPPSDVLLMQRLIEASASSEVLIRELAAVIYDNFPVSGVLIGRLIENNKVEALAALGLSDLDVNKMIASVEAVSSGKGGRLGDVQVVKICEVLKVPILVYFRSSAELDMGRLQPMLRQAELGLETCSLRVAARGRQPVPIESRIKTVMPGFIIGSQPMFDVIDKIQKIRTSSVTVLITGESGTGKELVARAIHAESARARAIFLPFNCTATPKEIIDSHLFGHRRGAFTGATENYPGIIRAADGGTLFLDEIGDLSLEIQPKLMRFLQESEIQPLGETRPMRVDVRVLAATNSDLERAVEDGRFRADLFHRLNIIRIHVPPLRDRREEIPLLTGHFLEHFISRSGKQGIRLTQNAIDALASYDWPGNVRQLRNEIERLVAYSTDDVSITAEDLSPEVLHPRKSILRSMARGSENWSPTRMPNQKDQGESDSRYLPSLNGKIIKLKEATAELETKLIAESLSRNKNNLSRTAIELGLSRRGLRLKLIQLGIARD